jgi:hypothetical protein
MWLMMNWWWRLVMTNPTNDQLDRHIAERVMGYAVHEYRKDEGWAAAIADIEPDDYPLIVLAESTIMQRLWCSGMTAAEYWSPSTSIADAWEAMSEYWKSQAIRYCTIRQLRDESWVFTLSMSYLYHLETLADTPARAISLALYRATGDNDE